MRVQGSGFRVQGVGLNVAVLVEARTALPYEEIGAVDLLLGVGLNVALGR